MFYTEIKSVQFLLAENKSVSLQHQSINQRKVTKIEREKQIFYITKNR